MNSSTDASYLQAMGIDLWLEQHQVLAMYSTNQDDAAPVNPVAAIQTLRSQHSSSDQRSNGSTSVSHISDVPPSVPSRTDTPKASVGLGESNAVADQVVLTQEAQHALSNRSPAEGPSTVQGLTSGAVTHHFDPAPNIHLQFWCYRSGVWFVSAESDLLPQHHQFVHNLALYLHGKKKRPKHVGVFSWPMIDAPNLDQSERVARHYLQQHIQQLESLSPAAKIFAFEGASQWLPDSQCVPLPALLSQYSEIDTKKSLWSALMPHRSVS